MNCVTTLVKLFVSPNSTIIHTSVRVPHSRIADSLYYKVFAFRIEHFQRFQNQFQSEMRRFFGHNVLMVGSPGAGKTLLARALPGILPEMSIEESLDVTRIFSVADQLPAGTPLIKNRPFRSPHHTISRAKGSLTFPANFQLIAAMNPCP